MLKNKIVIKKANEQNLKNINLEIPKNKLVVFTGLSGSGKSTLAINTIYAEGQRRYMESLSSYARQFIGKMQKPEVEAIEGLSPSISIDQKTTSKNPRSTVGTITEINDYIRLLFARTGKVICPNDHIEIFARTNEQIQKDIIKDFKDQKINIYKPLIKQKKGTHKDLFNNLKKEGFSRVKINNEIYDLDDEINLEKNKKHTIDVLISRINLAKSDHEKLIEAIEIATKKNHLVKIENSKQTKEYSTSNSCIKCGFSVLDLEPNLFSFNTPLGYCADCEGLGIKNTIDFENIVQSMDHCFNDDPFKPRGYKKGNFYLSQVEAILDYYDIDKDKPFKDYSKKELELISFGSDEPIDINLTFRDGNQFKQYKIAEGIITNLERRYKESTSNKARAEIENFMNKNTCKTCNGARLNEQALSVHIQDKNIHDLMLMPITDLYNWVLKIEPTFSSEKQKISSPLIKEIKDRTSFLINVGLDYLSLSRSSGTLSGGESQRIRLATQIGSKLTGVLYVLDEPSIGLHQRDNERLINALKSMRDIGNTLIVVEHDEDTILAADHVIEIGPGAGINGGEVTYSGKPEELKKSNTITGEYLSKRKEIKIPRKRLKSKEQIEIIGAKENNLKNINVKIPLNVLNVVSGVSGSGKSSLINDILVKELKRKLNNNKEKSGKFKEIKNIDKVKKIIDINQSPIGRTPRSNPATYTGIFDDIRDLFAQTKAAKEKGYLKGRFSFNVSGGRCEACQGDGVQKIEMFFMSDVYVTCEVCKGKRYNTETLKIKYKDKNIHEVLNMSIEEARIFFENIPKVTKKMDALLKVGLGYIKLGQPSTTLSGGESQRVKLASELYKTSKKGTMYILDEPSTGLHFEDVNKLIQVILELRDKENTVLVIEHNLDIIKMADNIIDIGPEGGEKGGYLIANTTPEELIKNKESYTGKFLKNVL